MPPKYLDMQELICQHGHEPTHWYEHKVHGVSLASCVASEVAGEELRQIHTRNPCSFQIRCGNDKTESMFLT